MDLCFKRPEESSQRLAHTMVSSALDRLVGVRGPRAKLFDPGIKVMEVYSLRRSLRRGSTTRATNRSIPKEIIKKKNWWSELEAAHGRRQGMLMMSHGT
jgi:hypothetical protein